jgi:phosphopantothenoylcysteine decarboxylase/phosphopantothenate--cysteine ligase
MAEATSLSGKTAVVGVTGGIAAYKAAEIVRWCKKEGAAVVVIMTRAARRFISPLTLETLSDNPVVTSLWRSTGQLDLGERPPGRKSPVEHIEIADAADIVIVAPATADFLARASLGRADDALTCTLLATRAPVIIAPAMNVQMWNHPATQEHLERLRSRGVTVIEPEEGELACRWEGKGRLASIEKIAATVGRVMGRRESLTGRHVVVAAGPTREAIDPVRYLSNHSSGKMGYRLAEAARDRGAVVTLVSGPVTELPPDGVKLVPVTSASGMKRAMDTATKTADAVIMAAAVADYRPVKASHKKIPREGDEITLRLQTTPDILKGVPRKKDRIIVGFALETDEGLERARKKLKDKGCDLIVLNDPTREDSAFGGDTNRVTLIDAKGKAEELPTLSKREVAECILDRVEKLWSGGGSAKMARRARGKR